MSQELLKLQSAPKIRILGNQMLIEVMDEIMPDEVKLKSGIVVSKNLDKNVQPPKAGQVVAISRLVAQNNKDNPHEAVELGEVVLFSTYAGVQFPRYGKQYALLRITDLLGVLEDVTIQEDNEN